MKHTGVLALNILLAVTALQATPVYESVAFVREQPFGNGDGSRIISGQEAAIGQFPHQVGITMDGSAFCGGSLISKQWVLSAGHCVDGFRSFAIALGAHNIRDNNEEGRITITTTEKNLHEGYNRQTIANDVSVIKLTKEVPLGGKINIIALPPLSSADKDFSGQTVRVSGWGKTSDSSSSISPTLQFVDLKVITKDECRKSYGNIITDTIYCCLGEGSKSTCNGDSGGALTLEAADKSRTHLGIVSFGSSRGCSLGYPTGYTATPKYVKWISGKTGIPASL